MLQLWNYHWKTVAVIVVVAVTVTTIELHISSLEGFAGSETASEK